MEVLKDQFRQLTAGVLHQGFIVRHGQHGNFGPDDQPFPITQIIKMLGMLVVRKADSIRADIP